MFFLVQWKTCWSIQLLTCTDNEQINFQIDISTIVLKQHSQFGTGKLGIYMSTNLRFSVSAILNKVKKPKPSSETS